MDFHALQQKLFEMDPTDPRDDLRKLQAQAQGGVSSDVPPTKDYVNESVEVPQGSMPLGIDSIADFAALAGVRLDERQKHADKVRGSEPMPKAKPGRTEHPFKNRLVGEEERIGTREQYIQMLAEKFYDAIKEVSPMMDERSARAAANAGAEAAASANDLTATPRPQSIENPRSANSSTPRIGPLESITKETTDIKQRLYAALAEKGIKK